MNAGFVSIPFNIPFSPIWYAIKARKVVVAMLEECVVKCKRRIWEYGEEPECLLDVWMESVLPKVRELEAAGGPPLPHSSNAEIALTVLDFLFASQDASTSSLVWTIALLAENPAVLERMRQEQSELRPNNEPISYDLVLKMKYTRQFVKELLRYRAPATMVPHQAVEEVRLKNADYVIPKGAIVLPSIYYSHFEKGGFPNPETFDPDRFSDERNEGTTFAKYWIPFGAGAHLCIGKDYAMNHLTAFASILSQRADFRRLRTPDSDRIVFLPTIFPADDVVTEFHRRGDDKWLDEKSVEVLKLEGVA